MHRELTFIRKDRDPDKDKSFCVFRTEPGKEIKVTITGQLFVELREKFKCDLETVCVLAAEHALRKGDEECDIEIIGSLYLAVKKELSSRL